MRESVTVRSYGKINWTLDILFKREDGFHELRTIFQTVSIFDRLRMTPTEGPVEIACNDDRVPLDETNLVHRAAVRLREAAGITAGARIEIEKRIPVAAGMAGGSSNGAAALLGLARLWEIDVDYRTMTDLAAGLGSDVPFFLLGGTVLGIGRGEEVYPLEEVSCDTIVLANPGFAVATAGAYASLSRLTRLDSPRMIPFTFLAARGIHELPLVASNDLEEPVLLSHPGIADVKRKLIALGARHALMSGSGATVFGIFDNVEESKRAVDELRGAGIWSERARTVSRREYCDTLFE